jgi:hypothetical protein
MKNRRSKMSKNFVFLCLARYFIHNGHLLGVLLRVDSEFFHNFSRKNFVENDTRFS